MLRLLVLCSYINLNSRNFIFYYHVRFTSINQKLSATHFKYCRNWLGCLVLPMFIYHVIITPFSSVNCRTKTRWRWRTWTWTARANIDAKFRQKRLSSTQSRKAKSLTLLVSFLFESYNKFLFERDSHFQRENIKSTIHFVSCCKWNNSNWK